VPGVEVIAVASPALHSDVAMQQTS
jgi:hypothetical protein